jgi:hypothetical protein
MTHESCEVHYEVVPEYQWGEGRSTSHESMGQVNDFIVRNHYKVTNGSVLRFRVFMVTVETKLHEISPKNLVVG